MFYIINHDSRLAVLCRDTAFDLHVTNDATNNKQTKFNQPRDMFWSLFHLDVAVDVSSFGLAAPLTEMGQNSRFEHAPLHLDNVQQHQQPNLLLQIRIRVFSQAC